MGAFTDTINKNNRDIQKQIEKVERAIKEKQQTENIKTIEKEKEKAYIKDFTYFLYELIEKDIKSGLDFEIIKEKFYIIENKENFIKIFLNDDFYKDDTPDKQGNFIYNNYYKILKETLTIFEKDIKAKKHIEEIENKKILEKINKEEQEKREKENIKNFLINILSIILLILFNPITAFIILIIIAINQ